jgi:phosphoribosylformylglycinamidine synthase subunit PurL
LSESVAVAAAPPAAHELSEVALSSGEYSAAAAALGRDLNRIELGMLGALWSEHCSYKTSKPLLAQLPTRGPQVLQGPGENAGAVDIGGGLACVFKIESHNHPSAIEPYQGAATGVGGILRDVFTMGARPVALLDSLRFGTLDDPHQRNLFDGVVAGIGGYGNCVGVPTVGGEVYFDESYSGNCIVNAMCVGVVEHDKLMRARAAGPDNLVLLVGADTGRDGIHGATFASVDLDSGGADRRPAVQVGNPFLEKCLLEACLELAGDPGVVAIQDLGAAGLCGSAAEVAHRGGCGIVIDVARVARREQGMTPYEVMLSESQERMLLVVLPSRLRAVRAVFERWDLHSDVVGAITEDQTLVVRDAGEAVAQLPLPLLVDGAPLRGPAASRPQDLANKLAEDPMRLDPPWESGVALLRLLASPNIGSRRPVFRRYDHQVGDDTIVRPGGDAAVIRVRGGPQGLAVSTDGNSRYAALDPRRGAMIAVCEAARNVVAAGARPLALTNCLNFGNPDKAEVFWQLQEAVAGIRDSCEALGIPVVSGNVSLYNDSDGRSIDPTVVIGMVGLLADVRVHCTPAFRHDRDFIALVGVNRAELGGSEYQRLAWGVNSGPRPSLDLSLEHKVQRFVLGAVQSGLLHSAHDCAEGGLAVALAECCILGGRGARIALDELRSASRDPAAEAGILFGECQSRFLVSFPQEHLIELQGMALREDVAFQGLGSTGGDRIQITGVLHVRLDSARDAFEQALA